MRVLSYNVRGWQGGDGRVDIDRLVRVIRASQADVVGLNEVHHPYTPPGSDRPALDLLAERLQMTAAFGVARMPSVAFGPGHGYGNALLSRLPMLAHAGHHLSPVEGHEQRGLLEVRLLASGAGAALTVYVTHLDHRSEAVRLRQLAALLSWTSRDRSRPHLLIGDFNALAPEDVQGRDDLAEQEDTRHFVSDGQLVHPRLMRSGYVDAGAVAGSSAPTYPAAAPAVRIDYIFLSEALRPALRSCGPWQTVDTAQASDHLPLLAELAL